jgi:hypothetical protein
MLATSQYQPRLSRITNVAPGESANQIAVFTVGSAPVHCFARGSIMLLRRPCILQRKMHEIIVIKIKESLNFVVKIKLLGFMIANIHICQTVNSVLKAK